MSSRSVQNRILVIEDDQQLLQVIQDRLTREGYRVESETTARAGLGHIQTHPPDFVVLDIMLPGGQNGFDVLEAVERDPDLKHIPVLVLTNLDHQREIALMSGAIECLVKTETTLESVVAIVKSRLKT